MDALVAAAFEEPIDGTVVRMLRLLESYDAVRASLVAVQDEELVGHVQLNRSWVDARESLADVLVLSPLSVSPAHQRAGIGTQLVRAALEEAQRLEAPAVFVEGSWDYYGHRGFVPATRHGFTRPSPRIPEPAFQVALLPGHEDWMMGPLVYTEAFWAADAVGLRDPLLAEIESH